MPNTTDNNDYMLDEILSNPLINSAQQARALVSNFRDGAILDDDDYKNLILFIDNIKDIAKTLKLIELDILSPKSKALIKGLMVFVEKENVSGLSVESFMLSHNFELESTNNTPEPKVEPKKVESVKSTSTPKSTNTTQQSTSTSPSMLQNIISNNNGEVKSVPKIKKVAQPKPPKPPKIKVVKQPKQKVVKQNNNPPNPSILDGVAEKANGDENEIQEISQEDATKLSSVKEIPFASSPISKSIIKSQPKSKLSGVSSSSLNSSGIVPVTLIDMSPAVLSLLASTLNLGSPVSDNKVSAKSAKSIKQPSTKVSEDASAKMALKKADIELNLKKQSIRESELNESIRHHGEYELLEKHKLLLREKENFLREQEEAGKTLRNHEDELTKRAQSRNSLKKSQIAHESDKDKEYTKRITAKSRVQIESKRVKAQQLKLDQENLRLTKRKIEIEERKQARQQREEKQKEKEKSASREKLRGKIGDELKELSPSLGMAYSGGMWLKDRLKARRDAQAQKDIVGAGGVSGGAGEGGESSTLGNVATMGVGAWLANKFLGTKLKTPGGMVNNAIGGVVKKGTDKVSATMAEKTAQMSKNMSSPKALKSMSFLEKFSGGIGKISPTFLGRLATGSALGGVFEGANEYVKSGNGTKAVTVGAGGVLGGMAGGVAGGALGGMAAGALAGSIIPGLGTFVGGLIGLIGAGIGSVVGAKLAGSGYDFVSGGEDKAKEVMSSVEKYNKLRIGQSLTDAEIANVGVNPVKKKKLQNFSWVERENRRIDEEEKNARTTKKGDAPSSTPKVEQPKVITKRPTNNPSANRNKKPVKTNEIDKSSTNTVDDTLDNVGDDSIRKHKNYQKYYKDALVVNDREGRKIAHRTATMKVRADMVKEAKDRENKNGTTPVVSVPVVRPDIPEPREYPDYNKPSAPKVREYPTVKKSDIPVETPPVKVSPPITKQKPNVMVEQKKPSLGKADKKPPIGGVVPSDGTGRERVIPDSPHVVSPSSGEDIPLDFMKQFAEGEAKSYNDVYGNRVKVDLENMTLEEVQAFQSKNENFPTWTEADLKSGRIDKSGLPKKYGRKASDYVGKRKSTAVGKYQFMEGTLKDQIKKSGLDPKTTKFSKEIQNKLAYNLMMENGGKQLKKSYDDYKSGKITKKEYQKSREQFQNKIAKQWASLPQTNGRGAYDTDGLNKTNVSQSKVSEAIDNLEESFTKSSSTDNKVASSNLMPSSGDTVASKSQSAMNTIDNAKKWGDEHFGTSSLVRPEENANNSINKTSAISQVTLPVGQSSSKLTQIKNNSLENASDALDATIGQRNSSPKPVSIINGGSSAPTTNVSNQSTTIIHAPELDATIRQTMVNTLHPARI
jgi:hypothetical protein